MDTIQNVNLFFWNFVKNYDISNSNILRKIIHSFSVAETCFDIACNLGLPLKERNFCYTMGLLHDIGRFEQWKLYETYDDNKSKNHGLIGYNIFLTFNKNDIFLNKKEFELLANTIKYHALEYEGKNKTLIKFRDIIRNADAYSNVKTYANGAQQLFTDKNGYTQEILDAFYNKKPLYYFSTPTKLDRLLKLTGNIRNINMQFLRENIIRNKYLDTFLDVYGVKLNNKDKTIFKEAIEYLKQEFV